MSQRAILWLLGYVTLTATLGGCGVAADDGPAIMGAGDLPDPIGTMTAGQLFTEGGKLSFVGGPWQSRNCEKGSCKARIQAVKGQSPGPSTVSTKGTIVARLQNRGSLLGYKDEGKEELYELRRFGDDKSVYYLVAIGDGSGGWTWGIYQATENGTAIVTPVKSGAWTDCTRDTGNASHPKGESEFARCPHPTVAGGQAQAMTYSPIDPGWLECSAGCCTAGE